MEVTHWMPWNRTRRTLPVPFERSPLFSLQHDMERLFGDLLGVIDSPLGTAAVPVLRPRVDLAETDEEYRVETELPGISEDDIEVSLADDSLVISGTKRTESAEKKDDYHHVERTFGSFRREVQLPLKVDESKIEAVFDKGVLTVRLPKAAEAVQTTHRIAVKSAD